MRILLSLLSFLLYIGAATDTVHAAPTVSPFAGSYAGFAPAQWSGLWSITISDGGRVSGSFDSVVLDIRSHGDLSGRIQDDGSISITVIVTSKSSSCYC